MTSIEMWRRACAGAKLAAVGAVVAGVMAFSAPAQAATTVFGLDADNNVFSGSGPYDLSLFDNWNITVSTNEDVGTAYIGFTSTEALQTISTTVMNPSSGALPAFDFAQAGWFTNFTDFTTGVFSAVPSAGDLLLSTSFAAAGITKYLVFDWSGINPTVVNGTVSLDTNLAAVPLPPALLLFLSGLAGIGFLGRVKAKRRERALAAA